MKRKIEKSSALKPSDNQVIDAVHKNLQINDFIPYRKLVESCGLKTVAGKSKQLQLDDLKRFIDYEYDTEQKKYLITKVRSKPLQKPPRKLREDALYTKYTELLLLSYIKDNPGVSCVMSKKRWWLTLSMVNNDYVQYERRDRRKEILNLQYLPSMDMENINAFYFRVNKRFTTLFYRSLENLEKRRLINYHRVYIVRYEGEEELHIASDAEESEIIDSEHQALEELNMKSVEQLYMHPELFDEFYRRLSYIQKNCYGIEEAYREIKIVHGKDFIDTEIAYSREELKNIAIECNKLFKNNIDNELLTSYKNYRLQLPGYDLKNEDDVKEMDIVLQALGCNLDTVFMGENETKNFIENQNILSDRLIKI